MAPGQSSIGPKLRDRVTDGEAGAEVSFPKAHDTRQPLLPGILRPKANEMVYDGITRPQIAELVLLRSKSVISVSLPTARIGADVQQGRIRLKNMLVEAEDRLVSDHKLRRTLAMDILGPAAEACADVEFWNDRLDSVGIYIAPGFYRAYHLPFTVREHLEIGPRAFVRPLLPGLANQPTFYVLALDQGGVRLLRCGPRGAKQVPVQEMPETMESFVADEHVDKQVQFHTAGAVGRAGGVIGHGAGDRGADPKGRLQRFSIAISRAVERYLIDKTEPVILAGVDEFQNEFRAESRLRHLLDDGIRGSTHMSEPLDLRRAALPIVAEYADIPREMAVARYRQLAGTGKTSQQIEEILTSAESGRVDVLFLDSERDLWGTYEGGITTHPERLPGDSELLNLTALATLENGGAVFEAEPSDLGIAGPLAAVYRY